MTLPFLLDTLPDWMERAECAKPGVDLDIFFPVKGDHIAVRHAKAICSTCPVATRCLAWALANETATGTSYRAGVYGGVSAYERRHAYTNRRTA